MVIQNFCRNVCDHTHVLGTRWSITQEFVTNAHKFEACNLHHASNVAFGKLVRGIFNKLAINGVMKAITLQTNLTTTLTKRVAVHNPATRHKDVLEGAWAKPSSQHGNVDMLRCNVPWRA